MSAETRLGVGIRLTVLLFSAFVSARGFGQSTADLPSRVSEISPGPNCQYELQARLIDAVPGDVIELQAGLYEFQRQLDVASSGLKIRGKGADKTILSYKGQNAGGAGIEVTGDNFWLEGLAIEDTAGNGLKILGANGVTIRDVRVEWTGPPESTNGAYGLYPVQCQNVLIENSVSIGASDAGIYVGQSQNVIVRNNLAERNVAGIEIENTIDADVYKNTATNNTGGILVFDLPGLPVKAGRRVRVFNNKVVGNNHPNFAAKGSIVSSVPAGTGVMLMATDQVEVFDNDITDHRTNGVAIISYTVTNRKVSDPTFDPFPELISLHDNRISQSGFDAAGELGAMLRPLLGGRLPDILWDGVVDPDHMKDGSPTADQIPSILNNGPATFANFDMSRLTPENIGNGKYTVLQELIAHARVQPPFPEVVIDAPKPSPASASAAVRVYRTTKQRLSEYRLFAGNLADHKPAAGVFPYDLNTPLFSDYTSKYRFVRLPSGQQIAYHADDVFDFPVGTVIAKTFAYPHDMTDASKGERLLETRIELRRDDNWYGFSYLWDDEQTDATLVLGGGELDVTWIHTDGSKRGNQYQIPNANQCLNCHQSGDNFVPIGPVAANLNRPYEFAHGTQNQLAFLRQAGHLHGAPDASEIDAWPRFDDPTSGTVERRARTWLHVNCAHCHNPVGTARTSGLDLRLSQTDAGKLGVWKTPVAAGHGTGGRSYDIVPGKPDESILLYRIESYDPSIAMPSVAKRLVPVEAAGLIREWIKEMRD